MFEKLEADVLIEELVMNTFDRLCLFEKRRDHYTILSFLYPERAKRAAEDAKQYLDEFLSLTAVVAQGGIAFFKDVEKAADYADTNYGLIYNLKAEMKRYTDELMTNASADEIITNASHKQDIA